MYKSFPQTVASVPFLSFGIIFGYLLHLQETQFGEDSNVFTVWPFLAIIAGVLITAALIVIPKNINGKYIFEHFLYLVFVNILYLASGLIFILTEEKAIALYVGAASSGILYIVSISYVTIRSEKQNRAFSIALCHVWKLCGIAVMRSLENLSQIYDYDNFIFIMGILLASFAGLGLILQALNEYRQRKGIVYNYRDSLDHDCSIANNFGKLFSKHEVIIERNNSVSATNPWKSTEQLLPKNSKNYTITWVFYMVTLKLHGSALFYYPLLVFSTTETSKSNETAYIFWFILVGGIIGCILSQYIRMHFIYPIAGIVTVIVITVTHVFLHKNEIVYVLWIYFLFMSISTAIPDIAIMEVSKMKYNESWLAVGCVLEFFPFAVLKFLESKEIWQSAYETDKFLINTLVIIIILVITSLFLILHMPNTFKKSLLQIQNETLKHKKYFAFQTTPNGQENRIRTYENIYVLPFSDSTNVFENHANALKETSSSAITPKSDKFDYDKEIENIPKFIPRVRLNVKTDNPLYRLKTLDKK